MKLEPSDEHVTGGWLFRGLAKFYEVTLGWTLRHQVLTMALFFLTALLSGYLYLQIPKGFFQLRIRASCWE